MTFSYVFYVIAVNCLARSRLPDPINSRSESLSCSERKETGWLLHAAQMILSERLSTRLTRIINKKLTGRPRGRLNRVSRFHYRVDLRAINHRRKTGGKARASLAVFFFFSFTPGYNRGYSAVSKFGRDSTATRNTFVSQSKHDFNAPQGTPSDIFR